MVWQRPPTSDMSQFATLDLGRVPTPSFVVDEHAVEQNLRLLNQVATESGAKVLAALKAFSMWRLGGLTTRYLSGVCASGIHEARLGKEEYGGEVHVFSAAFSDEEFEQVLQVANHVVFNSISQWQRFRHKASEHPHIAFGLRINPEHSEGTTAIYDPCAPGSRLGITLAEIEQAMESGDAELWQGISGIHFHTLCEQGFEPLSRTLAAVEDKFGRWLPQLKWVNFGGGHHITQNGYNVEGLIQRVKTFSSQYKVQVYLEPGEAVAINTGVLVAQVLDVRGKQQNQLILDTSATCHMPDTLEMPYRPEILGAGGTCEKPYSYQLGGMTCLAGDRLNEYSFDRPVSVGDRLVFMDMSHYTMVKTTTFNGINLPNIVLWNSETDQLEVVKQFGYQDFKTRLS